ncbi:MAG: HepT-like ribonuclease domain-containing protein [Rhizobiaceae bacterium]
MSRDWQLYWNDILEAVLKVRRYTQGMDQVGFSADERTRDAVLRNLEIIGEAAKHIPADIKAAHLELDWKRIVGFRDVIAHAYFGIDDAILWNIISVKIDEIHKAMTMSDPTKQ